MKYDEDKEEEKKPARLWSIGEEKEVNGWREMVEERREGPNVVEEKGGGIEGGGLTVLF